MRRRLLPIEGADEATRLDELLRCPKDWLIYDYDFGDSWEVREETGLDVAVLHLTGYYHDAEADFLHFVFLCETRAGDAAPRPDLAEVSECRYWPNGALPRPISDFTIRRIHDALAGVKFRLPSRVGPRVWLE